MSKQKRVKKTNVSDTLKLGVGTFSVPKNAQKYILDVLHTKRLSYGPYLQRFEREFSARHGAKYGVVVSSGTDALRIGLACLKEAGKWRDGDEVIIPSVTFVSDINIVTQNNLKPVFVDVDSKTYNINPENIERAITSRTRAIIPSHLFGQPADMQPIMNIARKHKLKVIEDSCETMFAKYRGGTVGSLGDIACFSMYVAHLIVTGVGGIITTNNPRYAAVLRSIANHGRDGIYISMDDARDKKNTELHEVVARRFRFIREGYSSRLTEFEGALGCAQLEEVEPTFEVRKRNAAYLTDKLSVFKHLIQLPEYPSYSDHVFMMFPIVIQKGAGVQKKKLVNFLEDNGIETRDMLPLINQPIVKSKFKVESSKYPVANWVNSNGFYIGCHQDMSKKELEYIVDIFTTFFKGAKKA